MPASDRAGRSGDVSGSPRDIHGCLCTPHDIWGYGYWGDEIRPGNVLAIPHLGAYTYSLRQEFIKPVPPVVAI